MDDISKFLDALSEHDYEAIKQSVIEAQNSLATALALVQELKFDEGTIEDDQRVELSAGLFHVKDYNIGLILDALE